jgi:hypothetical protein
MVAPGNEHLVAVSLSYKKASNLACLIYNLFHFSSAHQHVNEAINIKSSSTKEKNTY